MKKWEETGRNGTNREKWEVTEKKRNGKTWEERGRSRKKQEETERNKNKQEETGR